MTGYTAPSTGRAVRAVMFDTSGTVRMAKAAGLPWDWDVTATSVTGLARQLLDEP